MNISKKIKSEAAVLRARLRLLSTVNIAKLERERRALMKRVDAIDRALEKVAAAIGVGAERAGAAAFSGKRKRTKPEVMQKTVLSALGGARKGLTAIELSTQTGLKYQSLVAWLKKNPDKVRSEGQRKERRYLLK